MYLIFYGTVCIILICISVMAISLTVRVAGRSLFEFIKGYNAAYDEFLVLQEVRQQQRSISEHSEKK